MLLDLEDLINRYLLDIRGVLHVGAHLAEEAPIYHKLGIREVWWVEGNPLVMDKLQRKLDRYDHMLVRALVAEKDGEWIDFHITNYDGMSSSILPFGTHPTFSPDTVFVEHLTLETTTIDTLVRENGVKANFLSMDLQGAELRALQGATDFLQGVDYVMSEVNKAEVYIGCAQIEQLDALLSNFERVETYWVPNQGWGDALWIRKSLR